MVRANGYDIKHNTLADIQIILLYTLSEIPQNTRNQAPTMNLKTVRQAVLIVCCYITFGNAFILDQSCTSSRLPI